MAARFLYCDPTNRGIGAVTSAALPDLGGRIEIEVTDAHQCFIDGVGKWRLDTAQTGIETRPIADPLVVRNPSNNNIVFHVLKAGKIRTNQTEADTSAGTKTHRMPIHNVAGSVIGYIPITDS